MGWEIRVDLVDQANITVWDLETQTEHFIRNAKSASYAGDGPQAPIFNNAKTLIVFAILGVASVYLI